MTTTSSFGDLNKAQPPVEDQSNEEKLKENINAYDSLVGEGKKFKDSEALAKSKLESDQFIRQLLEEKEQMRKDLEKRVTLEQVLERIDGNTGNKNSVNSESSEENQNSFEKSQTNTNNENQTHNLNQEDIESLLEKKLKSMQEQSTRVSNMNSCIETMKENWGEHWQYTLSQKAKELGANQAWLEDVASSNPNAFIKLVGASESNKMTPTMRNKENPPSSSYQSSLLSSSNNNDYSEWNALNKLRKEDPKTYWSAQVQQKIMKLAREGKVPSN